MLCCRPTGGWKRAQRMSNSRATIRIRIARAARAMPTHSSYTSAFTSFPAGANAALQARRAIAAANTRRFPEAAAALNASPAPAGEARAEVMFNLAVAYGRAKQWAQARSTTDDLHRAFPQSA